MVQTPKEDHNLNEASEIQKGIVENEVLRMILIETMHKIEKQDAEEQEAKKQDEGEYIEKNDVQILVLRKVKEGNVPLDSVYYAGQFGDELKNVLDDIRTKRITLKEIACFSSIEAKKYVQRESDDYMIQCLLLNETADYYGVVEFILEKITKKVEYGELIRAIELREFLRTNSLDNRTILLEKYTQQFLKQHQLPSPELLIELSAQKYEGSESEARIYVDNDSRHEGYKKVFMFDDKLGQDYTLESRRLRFIRKLMEMSKRDALQLLADKDMKHIIGLISINKGSRKEIDAQRNYICFNGYMQWSVYINGKEEICYKQGKYYINSSKNKDIYEKKVDEFTKKMNNRLEGNIISIIRNLVAILKEQKHGTTAILTNDSKEAGRLCEMGRGMLVEQDEQKEFRIAANDFDREKLLSITEIDGALFMDMAGRCTAFGVIVDGVAEVKGDTGRGARYNSIYNYIYQRKIENKADTEEGERKQTYTYIALIFSEDGGVDIIDNMTICRSE